MTEENKKKIYEAVRNVCLRAVTGWDAEIDDDNFEEIVDEELISVIDEIIKNDKRLGTITEEYYIDTYITEWKDNDNVIISLWNDEHHVSEQVGVVELAVYKHGEHQGEALVWNLYVDEDHRRKGLARKLMDEAHKTAKHLGAKATVLEWSLNESPYWVFDWYTRLDYDEKEIGNGYALMKRPLTN